MKSAAFDYVRPRDMAQVFDLLETYGDEARIIAGGQTLLATLNMRLSEPQLLIDIGALDALRGITLSGSRLRIGAMVTHAEIEDSALVRRHAPLLSEVAPHVAHRAVRNLGTFGGSIAFADPAAEWPACLVALRGSVLVAGAAGERRIEADDFFVDLYTTALRPGEVILACEVPIATAASIYRFDELVRRHGDYAIVGAAVAGSLTANGLIAHPRVVFLGTGNIPDRARAVEALLATTALTADTAATLADALDIEPGADLYHSAQTKRHLSRVVLKRLLCKIADALVEAPRAPNEPYAPEERYKSNPSNPSSEPHERGDHV